MTDSLRTYGICLIFSEFLMVLFVAINFPYYKVSYGEKATSIVIRTLLLNTIAIAVAWVPVVYYWPLFSKKFLLPFTCIIGALGSVGSRFIYHEIIPDELAKRILEVIERKKTAQEKTTSDPK